MPASSNELSACAALDEIAAGRLSAEALTRACLERIAEREPVVRAFAHLDPGLALAEARRRDRGGARGPLHGLPFAVKDMIDTADRPTGYGSQAYAGHRPAQDAACVALARAAGAVILGKTVTTEFALPRAGPTANPHDPARTPGGSSSGSAAAVADCMVPVAFGTQTGGSMIRPASYCGVVGYKPSLGTINRTGVKPLAESFDTVGLFARSVEDVALVSAVLAGEDAGALPHRAGPARPRRPLPHAVLGGGRGRQPGALAARPPRRCRARASASRRSSCRPPFDAFQRAGSRPCCASRRSAPSPTSARAHAERLAPARARSSRPAAGSRGATTSTPRPASESAGG